MKEQLHKAYTMVEEFKFKPEHFDDGYIYDPHILTKVEVEHVLEDVMDKHLSGEMENELA